MNIHRLLSVCAVLLVGAACTDRPTGSSPGATPEPSRISLAIPARSNSAPAIAGFGKMVAVAWTASTDALSDVYISISEDGGATFGAAVRVNDIEGDARASGEQATRVLIGPGYVIHAVWPSRRDTRSVIRYATSTDRGRTFSKAATVAGEELTGMRGWQSAAVGYDGGLHAVWLDGRNARPAAGHSHGASAGKGAARGDSESPRQDLFHASWKGERPGSDRPVAERVCFCCKTAVATSGDRVYVAWRHIFPGSIRDIAVARSTDNGASFGQPMRLSDDGWKIDACPDDGPSMAADGHGGIHLAWPTLVRGETPRKGIFYSSLTEAGAFASRLRLDAGDADPAHPQIASDEHGVSAVVWDERAGTSRRIVLRRVVNGAAQPAEVFEAPGVNYPVVAAAERHWVAVWSAQRPGALPAIEGRRLAFQQH
jgi:hypothetical protein